jgi:hypothetical protein
MSSTPTRVRARRRRSQQGAAVVEAALVISFFLIPLMVGTFTLGERLWQAQKKDPYEPRIASSQVVGVFTCTELVSRVETTVANNIQGLGVPISPGWVEAEIVEIVPDVGVLVEVKVTVPPPDGTGDPVVTEASVQLENASLTTSVCG